MRVLTFNLHSTYLYLLSHTGWDIENLIVPPTQPYNWHTQPYGYPTHSGAVHGSSEYGYKEWFPADWHDPPKVWLVPQVPNITNVEAATGDYDLVIYIERVSRPWYTGEARKKVMVNLVGDDYVAGGDITTVIHTPKASMFYIPMGVPDDFLSRAEHLVPEALSSFACAKFRSHMLDLSILSAINEVLPLHRHDMAEEEWSYDDLRAALSHHQMYVAAAWAVAGPVLATIEALSSGIPTILFDKLGQFTAFPDEAAKRVTAPHEAIDAAKWLLADANRAWEMGQRAREVALKEFALESFIEGWLEVAK